MLNVRTGPGTDYPVAFTLAPRFTDVTATGHNRSLGDGGFWVEVSADGDLGWASVASLAHPGQVTDITGDLGELPAAETMVAIAEQVGALRASEEPRSDIVIVTDPEVGDLGEIKVDVIGLGDDAQSGERLRVSPPPTPTARASP